MSKVNNYLLDNQEEIHNLECILSHLKDTIEWIKANSLEDTVQLRRLLDKKCLVESDLNNLLLKDGDDHG